MTRDEWANWLGLAFFSSIQKSRAFALRGTIKSVFRKTKPNETTAKNQAITCRNSWSHLTSSLSSPARWSPSCFSRRRSSGAACPSPPRSAPRRSGWSSPAPSWRCSKCIPLFQPPHGPGLEQNSNPKYVQAKSETDPGRCISTWLCFRRCIHLPPCEQSSSSMWASVWYRGLFSFFCGEQRGQVCLGSQQELMVKPRAQLRTSQVSSGQCFSHRTLKGGCTRQPMNPVEERQPPGVLLASCWDVTQQIYPPSPPLFWETPLKNKLFLTWMGYNWAYIIFILQRKTGPAPVSHLGPGSGLLDKSPYNKCHVLAVVDIAHTASPPKQDLQQKVTPFPE